MATDYRNRTQIENKIPKLREKLAGLIRGTKEYNQVQDEIWFCEKQLGRLKGASKATGTKRLNKKYNLPSMSSGVLK